MVIRDGFVFSSVTPPLPPSVPPSLLTRPLFGSGGPTRVVARRSGNGFSSTCAVDVKLDDIYLLHTQKLLCRTFCPGRAGGGCFVGVRNNFIAS